MEKTLVLGKIGGKRSGWLSSHVHSFEQSSGDSEGQGNLMCWSPWGCKKSDTIEQQKCCLLLIFQGPKPEEAQTLGQRDE